MNKKGIVLAITMVVLAILLVLTVAYFSSLIQENKVMSIQKTGAQSLLLSEAGANHALSELRHRIRDDLNTNVSTQMFAAAFQPYVNNNDPLGFLRDFAFNTTANPADTQFAVANNKATLSVTDASLNVNEWFKGFQGGYIATITVEANGNPNSPSSAVFLFPYKFSITSEGGRDATGITPQIARNVRLRGGTFIIRVRRQPFARFALFTELQTTPAGVNVWFIDTTNFTGPVNTNGRFNFANNPSGHFTEEATQHEARARFYNNGSSVLLDNDHNGTRDVPTFDKGFQRGQDAISLDTSISQADVKNQALGGGAVPPNGINVPNSGGCVTGGIYIRGSTSSSSDDSTITMGTDASNNPRYTIIQGSGGTRIERTITVDYANNQTIVNNINPVSPTNTFCGIPDGVGNDGIIIYSNDTVKSFSGTVQRDTRVTVCSEKDIVITNNVRYQDYTPSPLGAEGYTNNLGIISWGGNVRIGTAAPNDLDIHGIVMAPNGIFTVDNYDSGSSRGIVNLLGGAITDYYGAFGTFTGTTPLSGYGRNFVYDVRMLGGTAPPYFPFMPFFMSSEEPAPARNLDDKLDWQDQG